MKNINEYELYNVRTYIKEQFQSNFFLSLSAVFACFYIFVFTEPPKTQTGTLEAVLQHTLEETQKQSRQRHSPSMHGYHVS